MVYSLLIALREGFEIALIVALILAYLKRTGNERCFSHVWLGAGIAALLCVIVGGGLALTASELDDDAQEVLEGLTMLFAAGVLTWMVFWMRRQAASLGRELREKVSVSLEKGSAAALVMLAFSAVIREGLETVLFLFAGSSNDASTPLYLGGAFAGFAVAAGLGYVVYRGSHVLPMRQFFTYTGIGVIILGAGLLSNGLGSLNEAGLIASLGGHPWNTESLISSASSAGKFLHAFLGYEAAPSVAQIAVYWGFLLVAMTAFVRGLGLPRPAAAPSSALPARS